MNNEVNPTTDQLFSRNKQRRNLLLKRQGIVLAAAVIFGTLLAAGVLQPFENNLQDAWFSRPQKAEKSNVVLVPVSAKSLQQVGAWPWPPFNYAVIIELLERWGARSVYIDHPFSEDRSGAEWEPLLTVLEKKNIPVFLPADFKPVYENTGPGLAVLETGTPAKTWKGPVPPVAQFVLVGHRQLEAGPDRVFRSFQPVYSGGGKKLALTVLKMSEETENNLGEKPRFIPWNRSRFENWPRVEFADLVQSYLAVREGMNSQVPPGMFNGKHVLIGLTDENQAFSGLTPWKKTVFPFEVMAAIFDGTEKFSGLMQTARMAGVILFICAAVFLIVWAGVRLGPAFWAGWVGFFLGALFLWGGALLMHYWLPCAAVFLFYWAAAVAVLVFDALYSRQERSALFHLATRDGLTNLYVIRHFRVIMNQMTREASARKEPLTVILMDIDFFKKINDTYGHPAGDMVLKKTADVIQGMVRQKRAFKDVDFVARYGGEEFIILIRRSSLETTAQVAERIRMAVQSADYLWNGTRISVTASLGVAALAENENIPDAMVHRADKALYQAKHSGRNRVCTESSISGG